MMMVRPFRGVRYNTDSIGALDDVLAPPYDVITPKEQDALYERDPNNVVRLILSREEGDARYEAAARTMRRWLAEGVLVQDSEPAVYPYYQEFEDEGRQYTRKGFIAAVRLQDFEAKKVLPHEQTFSGPKEDRLKLTRSTRANLSPVFSIYSDPVGSFEAAIDELVADAAPLLDCKGTDNVRNLMWKLTDPDMFELMTQLFDSMSLLIADGHHRYETALNYRTERRTESGNGKGDGEYEYVMMYLTRAESEGLLIKPTYRVAKTPVQRGGGELLDRIREQFSVKAVDLEQTLDGLGVSEFCLLLSGGKESYKLSPLTEEKDGLMNQAVMLLHDRIFGPILDEEASGVVYTKSLEEVLGLLVSNPDAIAFLLPPSRVEDIFKVTLAGEKMPHKTTYFYPKILSGLVFHTLD